MTEEYRNAIAAMTDDERANIFKILNKARHDNIHALICSLFTLADGYGEPDMDFINSNIARINDVHARYMRGRDREDARLAIPESAHYVFEPFKITRCAWNKSERGYSHLTFYGDVVHSSGITRDGVVLAATSIFSNLFGR